MGITPCFDPTTGASGGAAATACGTVTPPAPTATSTASGGTPPDKTFGAFSDPEGVIASYDGTLKVIAGTPSLTSGSGLGAYAVAATDGDAWVLYLDAKNAAGDIVSTAVHGARVASGAAWTDLADLDYTGLDVASIGDAAVQVTKGAVKFGPTIKVARVSSSVATLDAGPAGITWTGVNNVGSLNLGVDVSTYVDFAAAFYLPLRMDMVFVGMTGMDGTTDSVQGGFCDSGANLTSAVQERTVRLIWASGSSIMNTYASKNNSNTNIATGVSQPTGTFCLTTVMYRSVLFDNFYTAAGLPSDATVQAGGTLVTSNSTPVFPAAVWATARNVYSAGMTLTRIRLRAIQ